MGVQADTEDCDIDTEDTESSGSETLDLLQNVHFQDIGLTHTLVNNELHEHQNVSNHQQAHTEASEDQQDIFRPVSLDPVVQTVTSSTKLSSPTDHKQHRETSSSISTKDVEGDHDHGMCEESLRDTLDNVSSPEQLTTEYTCLVATASLSSSSVVSSSGLPTANSSSTTYRKEMTTDIAGTELVMDSCINAVFESEQFTTAPSTITVMNPIASWETEDVSVKPEEIQQGQDNAKNGSIPEQSIDQPELSSVTETNSCTTLMSEVSLPEQPAEKPGLISPTVAESRTTLNSEVSIPEQPAEKPVLISTTVTDSRTILNSEVSILEQIDAKPRLSCAMLKTSRTSLNSEVSIPGQLSIEATNSITPAKYSVSGTTLNMSISSEDILLGLDSCDEVSISEQLSIEPTNSITTAKYSVSGTTLNMSISSEDIQLGLDSCDEVSIVTIEPFTPDLGDSISVAMANFILDGEGTTATLERHQTVKNDVDDDVSIPERLSIEPPNSITPPQTGSHCQNQKVTSALWSDVKSAFASIARHMSIDQSMTSKRSSTSSRSHSLSLEIPTEIRELSLERTTESLEMSAQTGDLPLETHEHRSEHDIQKEFYLLS
ncbi:uncharacterized protein LOC134459671 [Engraulis encrasicolus]|uniref:uncharacterized protein LOC134459671 n=1 Tax=Engraulis encrasicolus TaxID=184585 RepID=UPI002FD1111E